MTHLKNMAKFNTCSGVLLVQFGLLVESQNLAYFFSHLPDFVTQRAEALGTPSASL